MKMRRDTCLFCDIARGVEPAAIVHEDDDAMVIMDLFPITQGHTLIIPKAHHVQMETMPEPLANHVFSLVRRTILAHKAAGWPAVAHNVLVNDGPDANQHVPHVHVHVIPRRGNDGLVAGVNMFTRMLRVWGLERRREALADQASELRQHFPTVG